MVNGAWSTHGAAPRSAHTHASLMLSHGVHPKIVSERLGHSTVSLTLDRYSHVLPGLQEAAAQAFDQALAPHAQAQVH